MENQTLEQGVERVIRNVHKFNPDTVITDIQVNFKIGTVNNNGTMPQAASPSFPEITKKMETKKVRKGVSKSLHREYSTSKEDIACIRSFFSNWKKNNLFTEGELIFIEQTDGVFYKKLSQETKQKIRETFEEVRTRVLFAKKNGTNRLVPSDV